MRPVLVARPHLARDQQRPEPGAVDEQIARQPLPPLGQQGGQASARAVSLDSRQLALDTNDTGPLGNAAQAAGIERRVEVIGIAKRREHGPRIAARLRKPVFGGKALGQRKGAEGQLAAFGLRLQPAVMKRDPG